MLFNRIVTFLRYSRLNKDDKYCKSKKFNHGIIINDIKTSTQIIQVRSNDKIISRIEFLKVFKQSSLNDAKNDNKLKKIEQTTSFDASSIDYTYKRIELTDDEFDELLSNFPCNFD